MTGAASVFRSFACAAAVFLLTVAAPLIIAPGLTPPGRTANLHTFKGAGCPPNDPLPIFYNNAPHGADNSTPAGVWQ